MIYHAQTAVGGAITGQMRLAKNGQVTLYVEGKVAKGGHSWSTPGIESSGWWEIVLEAVEMTVVMP